MVDFYEFSCREKIHQSHGILWVWDFWQTVFVAPMWFYDRYLYFSRWWFQPHWKILVNFFFFTPWREVSLNATPVPSVQWVRQIVKLYRQITAKNYRRTNATNLKRMLPRFQILWSTIEEMNGNSCQSHTLDNRISPNYHSSWKSFTIWFGFARNITWNQSMCIVIFYRLINALSKKSCTLCTVGSFLQDITVFPTHESKFQKRSFMLVIKNPFDRLEKGNGFIPIMLRNQRITLQWCLIRKVTFPRSTLRKILVKLDHFPRYGWKWKIFETTT